MLLQRGRTKCESLRINESYKTAKCMTSPHTYAPTAYASSRASPQHQSFTQPLQVIYKSVGMGVIDLAMAKEVFGLAITKSLGVTIPVL